MLSKLITVISICFCVSLSSQDLEKGFLLLETQEYSQAAQLFSEILDSDPSQKTARICYARALGLGGFPSKAYSLFLDLSQDYPEDTEVALNLAESLLWKSDYLRAIEVYDEVLKTEPNNFVANYGYANAHAGIFEHDTALKYVNKAITLDQNNSSAKVARRHILLSKAYHLYKSSELNRALSILDLLENDDAKAQEIRQLIAQESTSDVFLSYYHSWDAGGYYNYIKNAGVNVKLGDKHKFGLQFSDRRIKNQFKISEGRQQSMLLANELVISRIFKLEAGLGVFSNKYEGEQLNSTLARLVSLEGNWSEKLYTHLSYKNELHNYSPELVRSNIVLNHIGMAINYNFLPALGFYNKVLLTYQSDSNQSKALYSSLYYTFSRKPLVRIGVNNNLISFADKSVLYFSPDHFHSYEGFAMINNSDTASRWKYSVLVALGYQKVGQATRQLMNRVDAYLAHEFRNGISFKVVYQYNNTAQATAIGTYSFNQIGLAVNYILPTRK